MWQVITNSIVEATGKNFNIDHKEAIFSGDSCLSYKVTNGENTFLVKINDKAFLPMLEAEAHNLITLNKYPELKFPEVITYGLTLDKSYLVLTYHEFITPTPAMWYHFGEQLAELHLHSVHGKFGWQEDNYLDQDLQPNHWQSNWRVFFAQQRIAWQLQLLKEKSIKIGDIDHIVGICQEMLGHHYTKPCLVHGNLCLGNIHFIKDSAIIYNPACYYGDREADLAFTELFSHIDHAFYHGYNDIYPLPTSFEKRKYIYNFYHLLHRANLYQGSYIDQAKSMFKEIIAMQ